jgi:hypothetical protein
MTVAAATAWAQPAPPGPRPAAPASEFERAKRAADAAEAALARALESAAAIERIRGELEAEQRARSIEVRPPLAPEPATPQAAPRAAPAPAAVPPRPSGVVHRVGPNHALKRPSEAARIAQPGDTVEIDAGTYEGDVAVWTQRGVTIRGVGGRVVLKAAGVAAEDRAIWIVRGAGVAVESIDFSGASVPDNNGAGLRGEAAGLTIRRCRFYDNQIGVAVGDGDGEVLIEESEFFNNTVDHRETGAVGHNVSIGRVASFTLRNSYIHRGRTGDNVRSRARANFILANRIMDERDGAAGTAIDVAEGHLAYIVGNVLHKGARGESQVVVSFASEAHSGEDRLYVVNNTIVTETPSGAFVRNGSALPALVANNVLVGSAVALDGPGRLVGNLLVGTADTRGGLGRLFDTFRRYVGEGGAPAARPAEGAFAGNWIAPDAGFADAAAYDYRLARNSPAIDHGFDLKGDDGLLVPALEYAHPAKAAPRKKVGAIDIGAFEFDAAGGEAGAK